MRPDQETSNAFVYCLAVSAARYGVGIIGFGAMSNHYHAVVLDREGPCTKTSCAAAGKSSGRRMNNPAVNQDIPNECVRTCDTLDIT